ncbi:MULTISPECIES: hypothetical protein [Streptomyces]|uniref:hypothetical protein n=1 Tax=Streptomyces TaxID=1883 RepID=UPI00103BEAD4|nr:MULTISPECIES: hypothetical protein [Streptomyces]MBT3072471.1 hypothetical protein [Streptomyces sp. COG21]MBT3080874.1 hypothetical protein [Streptomyces sp. COG20]MBT3086771.1 hypothetical protein [Streptomyces sp. CYG21]MBT3099882.1 hypothetical protein [Streptomyces sp. CBG30]MBT3102463.1 hypothetical protein [Streptomyces sp. COG19]
MTGPRTEPVRLTVRYEPGVADGAPHRGVAAAVEAVDEDLCSVGWFALRADAPVVMELPRHGRYLLRGRTPDGQLLRTQTEVVADARPAAPREVRLRPEGGPVAGTPPPAPPRFSVTSPVRPPGAGLARVRIEQADGWSTETSAPVGTELLEIVPAPHGRSPGRGQPPPVARSPWPGGPQPCPRRHGVPGADGARDPAPPRDPFGPASATRPGGGWGS